MNWLSIIIYCFFWVMISCKSDKVNSCFCVSEEELAYELICIEIDKNICMTIGKMVRIDAPALISFNKYKKLDKTVPETLYSRTNRDNKTITEIDTILREYKLFDSFSYGAPTFEIANDIHYKFDKNDIIFKYKDAYEQVALNEVSKSTIENILNRLTN